MMMGAIVIVKMAKMIDAADMKNANILTFDPFLIIELSKFSALFLNDPSHLSNNGVLMIYNK